MRLVCEHCQHKTRTRYDVGGWYVCRGCRDRCNPNQPCRRGYTWALKRIAELEKSVDDLKKALAAVMKAQGYAARAAHAALYVANYGGRR